MKDKEDHFKNDDEKLRFENELKKMKLSLERGATFSKPPNNEDLPPEIENEFLKNIEAFEKAFDEAKRITVYNFIGRPEYLKAEQVPDHEISQALENVMQVLDDHGIALSTLCEVDDRTLYTFITDELFLHEMDDMRIEGMVSQFIYEEFHPNHEYDIRNYCTEFIQSFLDKSSKFFTHSLTREAEEDQGLKHFRDAFESFSLHHFEISSLTFDEQNAKVVFIIDYSGSIENSREVQKFSGEGNFELIYQYGYWYIHKVNLLPRKV